MTLPTRTIRTTRQLFNRSKYLFSTNMSGTDTFTITYVSFKCVLKTRQQRQEQPSSIVGIGVSSFPFVGTAFVGSGLYGLDRRLMLQLELYYTCKINSPFFAACDRWQGFLVCSLQLSPILGCLNRWTHTHAFSHDVVLHYSIPLRYYKQIYAIKWIAVPELRRGKAGIQHGPNRIAEGLSGCSCRGELHRQVSDPCHYFCRQPKNLVGTSTRSLFEICFQTDPGHGEYWGLAEGIQKQQTVTKQNHCFATDPTATFGFWIYRRNV